MLKNTCKYLYRFSLYSIAFLILLSAVAITLIRLTLPDIDSYREETQNWISQYMDYPVEIVEISADWHSWNPNLHLSKVSVLDPESAENILDFNSVQVRIDILNSLRHKQIIPKAITVSGLDLTLIKQIDGSITATKETPENYNPSQLEDNLLTKWFLAQRNILIKDVDITLFDLGETNDEPLKLSNANLRLRNNEYRTQIEGAAILPAHYGQSINFALDASGDMLTPNWSGQFYVEGQDINISPLIAEIEDFNISDHEGTGDVKLWSTWKQAKLREISGYANFKQLKLADQQSDISIENFAANFSALRRADKGVEVNIELEEITTPNGTWPETNLSVNKIYIDKQSGYRYTASASYMKLEDIDAFINVFAESNNELSFTKQYKLSGELSNSLLKFDPSLEADRQLFIETEFSNVGGEISTSTLGVKNLSGHIQGTQREGTINLQSSNPELDLAGLFPQPFTFYELNSEISWSNVNTTLQISTDRLDTHTQDFDLGLKGSLTFEQDKALPFIDIIFELKNAEVDKVANYLPSATPEDVRIWLKDALVAGHAPQADFVFRGWLDEYPFDYGEGVLRGTTEVHRGTLNYHPDWPMIDDIHAYLTLHNDTLIVDADSGNFYDARIKNARATIADLADENIEESVLINGHVDGSIKDGLLFVKNTPLKTTDSLKDLPSQNISGGLGLDLSLDIPLPPGLILIDGTIQLKDTLYESEDIGITLTKLNGDIHFTHESVSAEGINGFYDKQAVQLAISSEEGTPLTSTLSGKADKQFISRQLLQYFPTLTPLKENIESRISGSTDWTISLTNNSASEENNKELVIRSNLDGLAIDLPAPLEKTELATPFELNINLLDSNKQEIYLQYANLLKGKINILEENSESKISTALAFGRHEPPIVHDEQISIIGDIDRIVASDWFELVTNAKTKKKNTEVSNQFSIDVVVNDLDFLNQTFEDVSIQLNEFENKNHLQLSAKNINGNISFGDNLNNDPIEVRLKNLSLIDNDLELNDEETDNTDAEFNPGSIPPLDVEITELIFNEIELGELSLKTSQLSTGLQVDQVSFNQDDLKIAGTGLWSIINNKHHTNINMDLNAASMKDMLETFRYDVTPIEKGATDLSLNAQWQGSPAEFSLEKLKGSLDMKIDKGQFTDIDPSAGRLFGLLSLQTLPRRLSLDFSDLFGKGLAFDNIEGHFNIENGNAYTNNLSMTGPSVNVSIAGRTGLVDQDYDQVATITPKVTDTLPVASALFGPIGIGVGAVIYLAGEIFQSIPDKIDTILKKQYTITGSWNEPQVLKISSNKEEEKEKS